MNKIEEGVSLDQATRLQKTLAARLVGKNGKWWSRRIAQVLEGALVGSMCTDMSILKKGVQVWGNHLIPQGVEEQLRGSYYKFEISDVAAKKLKDWKVMKTPPLDLTLSEVKSRRGLSGEEMIEFLGEDAILPLSTAVAFLENNLKPKKQYVFTVRDEVTQKNRLFWVDQELGEGDLWTISSSPLGQKQPQGAIFVHQDFLSKKNALQLGLPLEE